MDKPCTKKPSFPIYQRHKQPFSYSTVYGIAFPITYSGALFDHIKPFGNNTVGMNCIVIRVLMTSVFISAAKVVLCGYFRQSFGFNRSVNCSNTKFFAFRIKQLPTSAR